VAVLLIAVAALQLASLVVCLVMTHLAREARQASEQASRDALRVVERVIQQAHAERADLTNRFMFLLNRRYDETVAPLAEPTSAYLGNGQDVIADPENTLEWQ
jgi:negative regulator of replication initiation